jgi:hypothetical protein
MGFFSGLAGGLLGGGEQSSSKGTFQSGFASLPPEIQKAFTQYGTQVSNMFASPQGDMFTPMGQTGDETNAFNRIRQGVAPTEDSLRSDISMFMNPFDDFVVNDINRQSQGQNSLVNQFATRAGQQGSNRSFLGSSDVEQNRLNNIGQFRQGQYNTAVNNALGPLANLRQQDIQGLLGIGNFQRGLDTQTRQAPYNALQSYGGLLGALPNTTTLNPTGSQSSSGGSLGGLLSNVASIGGTIGGFFSDERLKENIVYVGEENGFPIYEYNYVDDDTRFIGVLAQDVEKIVPEAVYECEGFKKVNYDMIGIEVRING